MARLDYGFRFRISLGTQGLVAVVGAVEGKVLGREHMLDDLKRVEGHVHFLGPGDVHQVSFTLRPRESRALTER